MRKRHGLLGWMGGVCFLLLAAGGGVVSVSAQGRTSRVKKRGVVVVVKRIDKAYAEAFANILAAARMEYEKTLGLSLPKTLELEAECKPDGKLRLWTDGGSHIFLTITSTDQLGPSPKTGVSNIYGMCHELGHMCMYRRMKSLAGLPNGVGEGWAVYTGSVVVDAVAKRLGDKIWPEPYDVAAAEGTARLAKSVDNKDWADLSDDERAAKVFYEIEKRHGREIVGKAMNEALAGKPSGKELMPLFVKALRKLTRDSSAGEWIPKEVLTSAVKWQVDERKVSDDFFSDLKTTKDRGGVLLAYDDGGAEGSTSSARSGHAVLFRAPKGGWAVDRVDLFGARYGSPQAPDEDFQIYVCSEDFETIAEINRPYKLIERGEKRWFQIPIDPVQIPERFYICLCFNPTATKGVQLAYDEGVARSHSRSALPGSHVADLRGKYDWMIRAHLKKSRKK